MSYIRNLSNPERLYVYRTTARNGKQMVAIHHGVEPPLASKNRLKSQGTVDMLVPWRAFRDVCRAWVRSGDCCPVECQGARVSEGFVYTDNGRRVPSGRKLSAMLKEIDAGRESRHVVRFSYKRRWFCMWKVTWQYVVDNALNDRGGLRG